MRRELHESHLRCIKLGLEILNKHINMLWLGINNGDHSMQVCTQVFYRLTLSLIFYRITFCLNKYVLVLAK